MNQYDRISDLLATIKKTRKQMCQETGISYNTLTGAYKRKTETINSKVIEKIAIYLDTTVEYLVTGNEKYLSRESIEEAPNTISCLDSKKNTRIFKLSEKDYAFVLSLLEKIGENKHD